MEQNEKIGMRIQALREEKGITQIELAKALNVKNRENIARWELGTRELKVGTIIQIAKYFNVSADYLLGMSDVKTTEQDIKIACKVTSLSEKSIENIKKSLIKEKKESRSLKIYINSFIENECFTDFVSLLCQSIECFLFSEMGMRKLEEIEPTFKDENITEQQVDDAILKKGKNLEDGLLYTTFADAVHKASLMEIYDVIKKFVENNAVDICLNSKEPTFIKEDTNNAKHNTPKE